MVASTRNGKSCFSASSPGCRLGRIHVLAEVIEASMPRCRRSDGRAASSAAACIVGTMSDSCDQGDSCVASKLSVYGIASCAHGMARRSLSVIDGHVAAPHRHRRRRWGAGTLGHSETGHLLGPVLSDTHSFVSRLLPGEDHSAVVENADTEIAIGREAGTSTYSIWSPSIV